MQQTLLLWVSVAAVVLGSMTIVSSERLPPEEAMVGESEMPPIPMTASMEVDGKPARPRMFQSTDQIRVYLDTLGKYYNFHNRNRFGKRTVSEPFANYQEPYERQPVQEYDVRSFG